jgi:hypothetical protein
MGGNGCATCSLGPGWLEGGSPPRAGRAAGLKGDALAADVLAKLKTSHADYPLAERAVSREVGFMEQELDGTKRVPQPAP